VFGGMLVKLYTHSRLYAFGACVQLHVTLIVVGTVVGNMSRCIYNEKQYAYKLINR